jgi:hypothetical protein
LRDLTTRLAAIEKEMKSRGHELLTIYFNDGTTYEMSAARIWPMFSDTLNKRPNADAAFFLEQWQAGNPDRGGLVYTLSIYAADPAEIWGDEMDGNGR